MKHIFIVNPAAGTGNSEKVFLPNILQFLKEAGVEYEIHRTLNKQEVGTWIKQRVEVGDPVRFYAIGGDGTVCDVATPLVGHDNAELAVIPCGSGNDFVKNFSNKKNFLSLEKQLAGKTEYIDVIKHNDSYSFNMLNIGADCDIVVRCMEIRKAGKAEGAAAYAMAALQILPARPCYKMTYTVNGEKYEDGLMLVAVGNGRWCGGGFYSCPKASLVDGLMDVGFVRPVYGPALYPLLVKYHQGTHLKDKKAMEKYIKYVQVSEFDLEPIDDCVVSVDGEVEKFTKTHFEVIPKGIRVVIPEGSELISK